MSELENVTFSKQMQKVEAELQQVNSEMMENVNGIIASFQQISLVAHMRASILHLQERKKDLTFLLKTLQDSINENKDILHEGIAVDSHYL